MGKNSLLESASIVFFLSFNLEERCIASIFILKWSVVNRYYLTITRTFLLKGLNLVHFCQDFYSFIVMGVIIFLFVKL